jgi:tetratricopeptide (TPR) repeat protein
MKKNRIKENKNFNKSNVLPKDNNRIQLGRFLFLLLALVILTLYVFQPSFKNDFVNWDDQVYVQEQPLVLNKEYTKLLTTPVSLNYHPLTMISLAAQVPDDIKDLSASPFIKANILLHILNTLLVFFLFWLLSGRRLIVSFITAAVFAIHPMHVESVVWVSERKDVLYTFFFLLSCITYWKYSNNNKYLWLGITFLFFLMSILSKAMGVVLPVVFFLFDFWTARSLTKKLVLEKIPFLLVSLFFGLMAISVQSGSDFYGILNLYGEKVKAVAEFSTFTIWQRFQFATYGFVEYVKKFFYPSDLCAYYPYPDADKLKTAAFIIPPVAFVITILLTIWAYKKNRIIAFGISFFLVTISLVLQFISVGTAIIADRYTYIPYLGLTFMIAYLVEKMLENKMPAIKYSWYVFAFLCIIFLSDKTISQARVWKNSELLWTNVLNYYPSLDEALAYRGNFRGKTGNIEGAMKDFEVAIADGCKRADVYEGLGNCYGVMSDKFPNERKQYVDKAISMYQKGLELDPDRGNLLFNLGVAQLQTNPAESIKAFTNALRLMPYFENKILPPLGLAYLNSGKFIEAIESLTNAIAKSESTDLLYVHRGLSYSAIGNNEAAIKDFEKALSLKPDNNLAKERLELLRKK